MKQNEVYKGFRVIDVVKLQNLNSTGIYLKHVKTGLEVFHILNDDEENLFAFAFRTPPQDSTGVAHVLEHSVLCGSEKYPAKDPFLQLTNHSVNTYLNAFTAPDKTVFPASSLIKSDYFNLMSVYADAVFFPLLKKEIFSQECWRLEDDKIQGVVFNEMKGNYASFMNVSGDAIEGALQKGTCYEHDSGGDPLAIPELTHSKLKAFHKKHYCTNNCLVFLYGNIPTEEQLDFLDENVNKKVKSYGKKTSVVSLPSPLRPAKNVKAYGPEEGEDSEDSESSVALAWQIFDVKNTDDLGFESIELMFLCELLFGHDCAPVAKVLLKKFSGTSILPHSGCSSFTRFYSVVLGLRNLCEDRRNEFEECVRNELLKISRKGFSRDDLERTFMGFDFSNREIRRSPSHGPYSIVLLRRVLRGWVYDKSPWECLDFKSFSDRIKENIRNDDNYLKSLVEKYFILNKNSTLITVSPSKNWSRKREAQERKIVKDLLELQGNKKFERDLKKMVAFQNKADPQYVIDSIPHLEFSDLKERYEKIRTEISDVCGVPYFINKEAVNGIVYASISFPADVLKASDYKYLSLLESTVCDMGWGNMSWDKAASIAERLTGSFSASIRYAEVPEKMKDSRYFIKNISGRDWFVISFKYLAEKADEVFEFVGDCISSVDFSEKKRLDTIVTNICKNGIASVLQMSSRFARTRSMRKSGRECAVAEILDGVKYIFNFCEFRKMKTEVLSGKLSEIFSRLRSSGAILHVTADKDSLPGVKKQFERLVKKLNLKAPEEKLVQSDEDFYAETEISTNKGSGKEDAFVDEVIVVPGSVGYSCCNIECSGYDTKEAMADEVLSHYLKTSDLWKQIRTLGGAYGVFLFSNSDTKTASFITFRDPKPLESLEYFEKFRKELGGRNFLEDEVKKAVTGVYSDEIEPFTPLGRGGTGFMRKLYAHRDDQDKRRMKFLLGIMSNDIKKAAQRFSAACEKGCKVMICGKSILDDKIIQNSRKIIEIPL